MPNFFISYRRRDQDGKVLAHMIFRELRRRYGEQSAFLDVDSRSPGLSFTTKVDQALKVTDVVLVIIGPAWLQLLTERLEDSRDLVRYEVAESLKRIGLPVVPVCLSGVEMPRLHQLPDELKDLVRRDGVTFDPFQDFDAHLARLLSDVERELATARDAAAKLAAERAAKERVAAEERAAKTAAAVETAERAAQETAASVVVLSRSPSTLTSGGASVKRPSSTLPDSFSATSNQSWFSRLFESIKSVLFGFIIFLIAFPVLFLNEGRAVRTARSLTEGAGAVVSVPADAVNAANEGKLVHVSSAVATSNPLVDDELGVQAQAVKLIRTVEMYQWKEHEKSETRKKLGGGTETIKTYTYEKEWADAPIDSAQFQKPEGHENPGQFPYEAKTIVADPVTVGAFTLSAEQLDKLNDATNLKLDANAADQLPNLKVADGRFYKGANPGTPAIGDVRISYQIVNPVQVSLVAVQTGATFAPYQAKAGDTVLLVEEGTHNTTEMFKAAQDANTVMTWILRAVGFFLMFLGLFLAFRPIAVSGTVVPLFGSMLGVGIGVFASVIAVVLSFITIAIAWIFVRPLLGITLLALAIACLVWLIRRGRAKTVQRPSPSGGRSHRRRG